MINIKNRLKNNNDLNIEEYSTTAQKALDALGYGDFDLGILLTTNKTCRHKNQAPER